MATMLTIKPRLARQNGNVAASIKEFPEGAGQTFKAQEFVMLTAGLLVVATDGSKLCGIALNDASGTSGTMIPVQLLDTNSEVLINLKQAASADHVFAAADLGAQYGIQVSSNVWTLNADDTTGPNFTVVDLHPNAGATDTNAWVYATPVAGKLYVA